MEQSSFASVFPGQGSQYVGMAKTLKEHFPWTKTIYEEASDSIQTNVLKLCEEGPEDTLQLTFNAQPCLLTTSFAWSEVCRRELDFRPHFAAGHSLGEYTALLSAGALTLTEAVRLVRTRGELMQSAVPQGKGKMAAVLGLDDDKVGELCRRASSGEHSLVVPANYNAPSQVVIAGHAGAVDKAAELANSAEFKARKVIPLKVSAPFHSPLMKPVVEKFAPFLSAVKWKDLRCSIAFNVDAMVKKSADCVELLSAQLDHPVLWTACGKALFDSGAKTFVEMGPSKVLTGLLKRIVPEAQLFSLDSIEELKKFEHALKDGGQ